MGSQDGTRGRVVVLTGASAGVGRATARRLAERGDRLALLARGEDALAAAVREAQDAGAQAIAIPTDVADPEQVDAAADRAEYELGEIDVWINDAMASVFGPVHEITPAEFRRVTEVTYLGQVYGTMAALDRMRPRDRGTIVNVGSALAYRAIPLQSAYCGAKFGVRGFTDALRTELMHDGSGVKVTMVQLPGLNTTQFELVRTLLPRTPRPVAPVYQPEIAAEAIAWATEHPERRELWVGASTVATILGSMLAPGLADRYLARTGYKAQQTDRPADERRRNTDYLEAPVPGDRGSHGSFDAEAKRHSPQLWLARHRRGVAATAAGTLVAAGGAAAALAKK
jgi:NADP-dependent 3-hydroxy acid dehydrogenase YdfG